ncbi:MAG TPA: Hsp20/alpha crystallin family protein [Candidatus Obscuribacterales bacterium]
MLLHRLVDNDFISSLQDMHRLRQQLNRLLATEPGMAEFPPINVFSSDNGALAWAEIPGIDPKDIDISLVNDTLTVRGERRPETAGDSCHRQERLYGQFTRTIQLPFPVEADEVKARFFDGILEISLPRAHSDKPRKITVTSE